MLKPQVVKTIPNVESFLRHCQRRDYKAKDVILKQGAASNSLYLILDGSVSVMVEDESTEDHMMVVSYLNPGDFVGEMGLFDSDVPVRSAMVVARTRCEVAEISYERFHQIRDQFPDILYAISRQLGKRLRRVGKDPVKLAAGFLGLSLLSQALLALLLQRRFLRLPGFHLVATNLPVPTLHFSQGTVMLVERSLFPADLTLQAVGLNIQALDLLLQQVDTTASTITVDSCQKFI